MSCNSGHITVILSIHLLSQLCAAFGNQPESIDFYYDPLMPRINDTLTFEADPFFSEKLKLKPKKEDYRWYYREMGSSPNAFRLIGVGQYFLYKVNSGFRDGYFNLSVTFCCNGAGRYTQLETVKLIRIQRPLRVQVYLDGNPLPGNLSQSSLALSKPHVNIECRIMGMPTNFGLFPPLGVTCGVHRVRNKRRYLAVIQRKCRFTPGTYRCTARNDLSHVVMIHYVQAVVPTRKLTLVRRKSKPTPSSMFNRTSKYSNRDRDYSDLSSDRRTKKPVKTVEVSQNDNNSWFHVTIGGSNNKRNGADSQNYGICWRKVIAVAILLYTLT